MPSFKRALNYLLHDRARLADSVVARLRFLFPDKLYLSLRFRCRMGYWINWKNPKTFSEKIQWLKIYDRKPEYTTMADKYAVKDYVARRIGKEYVIPTLGVWDKPEDIEWEKLPEKFVLKTTHGGGGNGVIICRDKANFDRRAAVRKLAKAFKADIYSGFREWPYKNVPRRIIAETLLEDDGAGPHPKDLWDYKFFCFGGEPKYCQVIRDRNARETIDFYDMTWKHMPFVGLKPAVENGLKPVPAPPHFDALKNICRELSRGIPFARIDLYCVNAKNYFGEITFFPASGMGTFVPEEWNEKLGNLLKLRGECKRGGGIMIALNDDCLGGFTLRSRNSDLRDYKFFCFDGNVKYFKIDFNRFVEHHANYYSPDGELLPLEEICFPSVPAAPIAFPENLKEMMSQAEKLSAGHKFLRVDLYSVSGKIFFGELTFYPSSGMTRLSPASWDETIGNYLELPARKKQ